MSSYVCFILSAENRETFCLYTMVRFYDVVQSQYTLVEYCNVRRYITSLHFLINATSHNISHVFFVQVSHEGSLLCVEGRQ